MRFAAPQGMGIGWEAGEPASSGAAIIHPPGRYNFVAPASYRLRLTELPDYPRRSFEAILALSVPTSRTVAWLAHNAIPLQFSTSDFELAAKGKRVVKVIELRKDSDEIQEYRTNIDTPEVLADGNVRLLAAVRLKLLPRRPLSWPTRR